MEMGLGMTIAMVAIMGLMVGGMVWGMVANFVGRRKRDNTTERGTEDRHRAA